MVTLELDRLELLVAGLVHRRVGAAGCEPEDEDQPWPHASAPPQERYLRKCTKPRSRGVRGGHTARVA
jgi:hypothetical protein